MLGADFVARHLHAVRERIDRVQGEMLCTRDEREHFIERDEEFLHASRLAGRVARSGDAAGQRSVKILKAGEIVQLPAVDGNGDVVHLPQGFLGVHAPGGIDVAGGFVLVCHAVTPFLKGKFNCYYSRPRSPDGCARKDRRPRRAFRHGSRARKCRAAGRPACR